MNQKQLTSNLEKLDKLKKQKSEIAASEKEIKDKLMAHLDKSGSESVAIGKKTIGKKVSSYGIQTNVPGVKKTEAAYDLTKELLADGKENLLSIKTKNALLHQMQKDGNKDIIAILKKHGVELVPKYALEIK